MSKPCYTCKDEFVNRKLEVLFENKKNDAREYAKKNEYTGAIAIVVLGSGSGFKICEETKVQRGEKVREYLLFNAGFAL